MWVILAKNSLLSWLVASVLMLFTNDQDLDLVVNGFSEYSRRWVQQSQVFWLFWFGEVGRGWTRDQVCCKLCGGLVWSRWSLQGPDEGTERPQMVTDILRSCQKTGDDWKTVSYHHVKAEGSVSQNWTVMVSVTESRLMARVAQNNSSISCSIRPSLVGIR